MDIIETTTTEQTNVETKNIDLENNNTNVEENKVETNDLNLEKKEVENEENIIENNVENIDNNNANTDTQTIETNIDNEEKKEVEEKIETNINLNETDKLINDLNEKVKSYEDTINDLNKKYEDYVIKSSKPNDEDYLRFLLSKDTTNTSIEKKIEKLKIEKIDLFKANVENLNTKINNNSNEILKQDFEKKSLEERMKIIKSGIKII